MLLLQNDGTQHSKKILGDKILNIAEIFSLFHGNQTQIGRNFKT